MRENVELFAAERQPNGFADSEISCGTTVGGNHGLIETRISIIFHNV